MPVHRAALSTAWAIPIAAVEYSNTLKKMKDSTTTAKKYTGQQALVSWCEQKTIGQWAVSTPAFLPTMRR